MKITLLQPLGVNSVVDSNVAYPSASDPPEWNPGTPYKKGALCRVDYVCYEALKDNSGISPQTDTDSNWGPAGFVNRFALVDQFIGSKTVAAVESGEIWTIQSTIDLGDAYIDTIGFFGLEGQELSITQLDRSTGEVIWENTINLQDESRVVDLYSYFFEPFYWRNDLVVQVPVYRSKLLIRLTKQGSPSRIGAVVAGRSLHLGLTQVSPESGYNDYSKKAMTLLGYQFLQPGRTAKRQRITVTARSDEQDRVSKIFDSIAGQPAIFQVAGYFETNIIYGFCKQFNYYYSTGDYSHFSADIEGLI